ncbi:hypothetical protein BX616_006847 [Lobosporangium transversale]|nr:hypothetical protein BX616_006847 [Lobosporangium transversale]
MLKHSLTELEKAMTVNNYDSNVAKKKESTVANGGAPLSAADYQELLKRKDKEHSEEIAKLNKEFGETKAHLEAQKDTMRNSNENANKALIQAASKMDLVMARINSMAQEHKQELKSVKKGFETALSELKATHQEEISRIVLETNQEKEELRNRHKRELLEAIAQARESIGNTFAEAKVQKALELELISLKEEVQGLRQSEEAKSRKIEALAKENNAFLKQLNNLKAELDKKMLHDVKDSSSNSSISAPLSTTPDSNTNGTIPMHPAASTKLISSAVDGGTVQSGDGIEPSKHSLTALITNCPYAHGDNESKYVFSWSQFVFPIAKRNQPALHQHLIDN